MSILPLLLTVSLAQPPQIIREVLESEAARRCARIVDLSMEGSDEPTVDVRQTLAFAETITRLETSRTRFTLAETEGGWCIAAREPQELAFVESLLQANDDAARARILGSSESLQNETFVLLASQRVTYLINARSIDAASALADAAEIVAERLGDPRSLAEARCARSLVARYQRIPDLDLSVELSREALALAEASGNADTLARTLVRLSRAIELQTGALDAWLLRRTLEIAGQLEEPSMAAHAATHLARSLEAEGRKREAFRYAELAVQYADAGGDVSARITAMLILGGAFLWNGSPMLALRQFQRASELAERAGFTELQADILASEMVALRHAGRSEEAARLRDEGMRRFPANSVPMLHQHLGLCLEKGRYAEAERDLEKIMQLVPPNAANAVDYDLSYATIRMDQGRYREVAEYAVKAQRGHDTAAIAGRMMEAWALRCLGEEREAIRKLEDLHADLATRPGDVTDVHAAFVPLGDDEGLCEMLVEQGGVRRALEVSEWTKAARLRSALERSGIGDDADDATRSATEHRQERSLEARVAELNRALLNPAPSETAALRQQLAEAHTDLVEFRIRSAAIHPIESPVESEFRLDELPEGLDDVTIVSYLQTEHQLTIFAIPPKRGNRREVSARVVPMSRAAMLQKITRFRAFVEQRNLRATVLGDELYALLLAPVEDILRDARSLCIVPHRDLWRVPFHALGPKKGPLLVERTPVFYAPSITVLAATEKRRSHRAPDTKPTLLAFANPNVGAATASLYRALDPDAPLGAIPETETEVRAIAAIYGKEHSRIHIGDAARETLLKREAERYDVLHIATHGMVSETQPMFSSLLFADGARPGEEDGVLEAREILGLRLDAETAVLSACDSGKAGAKTGEGIIGLSWAFLVAGCRTTVVSQWKAQSAATSMLMIELHRQLANGLSNAEALRVAQLKLRRDARYTHPFYWAPFIVVGAP